MLDEKLCHSSSGKHKEPGIRSLLKGKGPADSLKESNISTREETGRSWAQPCQIIRREGTICRGIVLARKVELLPTEASAVARAPLRDEITRAVD